MIPKKILFDIGHPAQVHNFKYLHEELIKLGWKSKFVIKNKEMALQLLELYKIPYYKLLSNSTKRLSNILLNIVNIIIFFFIALMFRPQLIISRGSLHSIIISKLLFIKHIMISDTEHSRVFHRYVDTIITGKSYRNTFGNNHLKIDFNLELFYLHPSYFKFINRDTIEKRNKVFMRFVSWNAHHDIGMSGIAYENKLKAISEFSKIADIYISSENELPDEVKKYKIKIDPSKIHDFISNCNLVYGESSTMASEAACLGVPAIYHDNVGRGYTDDEESYGLTFNYSDSLESQKAAINKGIELLKIPKSEFSNRRNKFLNSKINPIAFMVWFIEDYPNSFNIIKDNPDYQYKFK